MPPLFSIIHPSCRPQEWKVTHDQFLRTAIDRASVEYVSCLEDGWGFNRSTPPLLTAQDKLVWSTGRKGCVASVNQAAAASTGKVLLISSDDFVAPFCWDRMLTEFIGDRIDTDFVVQTAHRPDEPPGPVIFFQILSRVRYTRLGYALYPEYPSVFGDNDFTEHAAKDGVILTAPHICFKHAHPGFGDRPWDEVYEAENSTESYRIGREVIERRRANGFADLSK